MPASTNTVAIYREAVDGEASSRGAVDSGGVDSKERGPRLLAHNRFSKTTNRPVDQLRLQSDFIPIGLIATTGDDSLTITEWNSAAEKIFGYTRAEAVGRSAFDLIVLKEDLEFVKAAVRPVADQNGSASSGRNVCKDGRIIWCRWFYTPSYDGEGRIIGRTAMVQDVTDQYLKDERMRLWSSVIQQSTDAIMICDANQQIVLVNNAFEEITGFSEVEAIGKTPRILHSGRQNAEFYAEMWRSVAETDQWRGEMWNRRKTGELYLEWLSLTAARGADDAVAHYIGIFSDITQRKVTEERVRRLAHFDALTGIPNRTLLLDRVSQVIAAATRNQQKAALLFIDLDRFKNINDSMGHEAGDELLKTIAKRLERIVRATDTVARMGGDEFVIALAQVADVNAVARIVEEVLATVSAPLVLCNQEVSVSASIGVCVYPDDASDVSGMIRNADAAMYRAKSAGRNAYQFYTSDMNARALECLETETALRHALQRNEFELYYQPQVSTETGKIVGVEALIRWHRPGKGLLSPGYFIPIAEERGLIAAIGNWTLREAVRQAAAWDAAGHRPVPIAINLSANEFHQPGFVEQVQSAINACGLQPARIELEITEGIIMRDADATIAILRRLHDFGVQLSIDDFGTGYSSLNYLRRFPIDKIKIDQSFVRDMLDDPSAAGIVSSIIGLAKGLRLGVIAEGVETPEQHEFLRAARCDVVQGYFSSRPLPAAEFEQRWLQMQGSVAAM